MNSSLPFKKTDIITLYKIKLVMIIDESPTPSMSAECYHPTQEKKQMQK